LKASVTFVTEAFLFVEKVLIEHGNIYNNLTQYISLGLAVRVHLATSLALHLDLAQQGLIELEFLAVHLLLGCLGFFLVHLTAEESCILNVDHLDLLGKTVLFVLVVLLVTGPQDGLFVIVGFSGGFTSVLLGHLSVQQVTHLILLCLFAHDTLLVFSSKSDFALHFVLGKSIVLMALLLSLVLDNASSHVIHELLSTALTGNKLALTVLFLFVEHADVLFLSLDVVSLLAHLVFLSLLLVRFIFN